MHHQDHDRIITARLLAAATRLAGWQRPEDEARTAAIAELRQLATVAQAPPHGSVHPPRQVVRTDLLGEVAGILLGFAPDEHPEQHLLAAELLREAEADEEVVQRYIPIGRERREGGGPAFSKAAPIGKPSAGRR